MDKVSPGFSGKPPLWGTLPPGGPRPPPFFPGLGGLGKNLEPSFLKGEI